MNVLNMRLNRRGADSGPPSSGQRRPSRSTMPRVLQLGRRQVLGAGQLVEPEALVVGRALDQRVAERADVPGRHPDLGVHEDPGVEPDDVVALLDHRPPPGALDVVLELDPERAVVPDRVDAAVDLARREDEAAALGERHDRVELGDGGRDVVGGWLGAVWLTRSPVAVARAMRDASRACRERLASRSRQGSTSASSRRTLPPMTFRDLIVVEPGVEQGVRQQHEARRIERHRHRAVEVGAERRRARRRRRRRRS